MKTHGKRTKIICAAVIRKGAASISIKSPCARKSKRSMPIIATRVYPPPPSAPAAPPSVADTPAPPGVDTTPLARLHPCEREYVTRSMKRRERTELTKMLNVGGVSKKKREVVPLRIQVLQSHLPEHLRLQMFEELRTNVTDKYLQWVLRALRLPLGVIAYRPEHGSAADTVSCVQKSLDSHMTGHLDAKREILKLVCQSHTGKHAATSAYALGFHGPPGTGKTHFVRTAVSEALGRPIVTIPLGGATDVSFLLGNMYTYEGSREGRLASALIEAKCCNPILHFDELDKISATERGAEISNVLIHLIDPSANNELRDRYFHGIDIDFSECTFVFTFNDASRISPILLDRIKCVGMSAPSSAERSKIVSDHLVPRIQRRLNTSLALSEEAVAFLLGRGDGGMRGAEKEIDHVLGSAHLCTTCDSSNRGGLVGAPDTPVIQMQKETPCVTVAFAEKCLGTLALRASVPPEGMYT